MSKMKIKAKLKNNKVTVKILAKSPMIGKEEAANKNNAKVEFITHMSAKVNEKVIWEVSTGPFLSKNPYIQFVFDAKAAGAKRGDLIEVIAIDSNLKEQTASRKIK